VYKILSKLVDKCWRYSKPNHCHFWAWLKRPIFGVLDSQGSAETSVRRGGITNYNLIAYSFSNISAKKLPKSVNVHWRYSVLHHWRFFETRCSKKATLHENGKQYNTASNIWPKVYSWITDKFVFRITWVRPYNSELYDILIFKVDWIGVLCSALTYIHVYVKEIENS